MSMFTIITIAYQNLAGLKKTAASITGQEGKDFQWIVIDGNSNDGTKDFIKSQPCEWISEPDDGIYDAMNKGIDRATGHYTIFMNAGDIFAGVEVLKHLKHRINKSTQAIDFIYGDAKEDGNYKAARSHKKIAWGMFTHHQSMLYRTAPLKQFRYDSNHNIAADYDLTCRFLARAQNAEYIAIPICGFEPGGLSQQSVRAGRIQQYQIRKNLKICSTPQNILIYSVQTLSFNLRRYVPRLYWFIKH